MKQIIRPENLYPDPFEQSRVAAEFIISKNPLKEMGLPEDPNDNQPHILAVFL